MRLLVVIVSVQLDHTQLWITSEVSTLTKPCPFLGSVRHTRVPI